MVPGIRRGLLLLLVLASLMALTGCDSSREGYRSLTEKNKLCGFSFEYSAYYHREGPYYDFEHIMPGMSLTLVAPSKPFQLVVPDTANDRSRNVTSQYAPAYIEISVYDPSKYFPAPYYAKDRRENDLLRQSKWENFEIFERYPVTVSGIECELVYYQVDWFLPAPKGEGPKLEYVRAVYFDYGGLIWVIEATCEMEMIEQVKADFEHILQTFKILD